MRIFYEAASYLHIVLAIATLVFVCLWAGRPGKALLISFSALSTLAMLVFRVNSLVQYKEWIVVCGSVISLVASVVLLAFVIVARASPATVPAVAASTAMSQARLNLTAEQRGKILHRREWTYVLDWFLMSIPCFLIGALIGLSAGSTQQGVGLAMIMGGLVGSLYFLFKDAIAGKSLAKAMTGLQVVDADTGKPIGIARSCARNWLFLFPVMPLVELIVANVREDKRRLGDLMANTVVLRSSTASTITSAAVPPPAIQAATTAPKDVGFYCPKCGTHLAADASLAGQAIDCPKCKLQISVPA
jgi:uncharacterized RDD family membrane protein YckC